MTRTMRQRLLGAAALLGLGAVGCAHCDTCDDFPTPCLSGNCGDGGPMTAGAIPGTPTIAVMPTMPADPTQLAPIPTGAGPFTATDATGIGTAAPTMPTIPAATIPAPSLPGATSPPIAPPAGSP